MDDQHARREMKIGQTWEAETVEQPYKANVGKTTKNMELEDLPKSAHDL